MFTGIQPLGFNPYSNGSSFFIFIKNNYGFLKISFNPYSNGSSFFITVQEKIIKLGGLVSILILMDLPFLCGK